MKSLDIVIPILNENKNINKIYKEIYNLKLKLSYRIIFVDDGSNDSTLNEIKKIAKKNKKVKYLSLSKNFGHQIALSAGLDFANADMVIMLDGDLQHPIKYIKTMIEKFNQGYDVVQMVKINQGKRNILIRLISFIFYSLFRKFSTINLSNNVSDFRLISKRVNNIIKNIKEKERFIRGLVQWTGFNYYEIPYKPNERLYGKSKYGFFKLVKLASFGIFSFSSLPLKISLYFGFLMSFFSFIYGLYAIIKKFTNPENMPIGYTDLIVFITFLGGIQIMFLGIIGLYLSKVFDQVRDRPLYLIKEKNIND